jgi:F-type H+-transporting ATPase subunit b
LLLIGIFETEATLESIVLSALREKSSMLRHAKSSLSGWSVVVVLAFLAFGRPLFAQEHKAAEPAHAAGVSHTAGPHAAESEHPNPMEPKPTLAIWTAAVFLGVLFILGRFAWKPLLAALHKRESHLEHVLLETERARNESESLMAEHRKVMSRAGDEVRSIMEKARAEAQTAADAMVKQAQNEADLARQRAQREIASARDQALAEIWQKTADMAVSVAGRVLSKELNPDDHRRLLDAAIKELPATGKNGHGGNS